MRDKFIVQVGGHPIGVRLDMKRNEILLGGRLVSRPALLYLAGIILNTFDCPDSLPEVVQDSVARRSRIMLRVPAITGSQRRRLIEHLVSEFDAVRVRSFRRLMN